MPNVDLGGGATRSRSSGETGQGPSLTTNRFDVSAGVSSFELDFWGRVRSLSESARANYLATIEAQRAQRELAAQRARANLATLRNRNGVAGYLEVLDAERDLFAAEQQTVATRREQLTNAVDLYVELGGGTQPGFRP